MSASTNPSSDPKVGDMYSGNSEQVVIGASQTEYSHQVNTMSGTHVAILKPPHPPPPYPGPPPPYPGRQQPVSKCFCRIINEIYLSCLKNMKFLSLLFNFNPACFSYGHV